MNRKSLPHFFWIQNTHITQKRCMHVWREHVISTKCQDKSGIQKSWEGEGALFSFCGGIRVMGANITSPHAQDIRIPLMEETRTTPPKKPGHFLSLLCACATSFWSKKQKTDTTNWAFCPKKPHVMLGVKPYSANIMIKKVMHEAKSSNYYWSTITQASEKHS